MVHIRNNFVRLFWRRLGLVIDLRLGGVDLRCILGGLGCFIIRLLVFGIRIESDWLYYLFFIFELVVCIFLIWFQLEYLGLF